MTKVIHVISSSGLYGAERSILGLIRSVKNYPHTVVCFDKPSGSHIPFVEALASAQIPVQVLPDGYGAFRENAKQIVEQAAPGNPLFLHAHGYKGTMTCGYVRKLAPQTRIICTQHGFTNKSLKTRAFTKFETRLIRSDRIDHVICASNAIRSFYLRKRVPAQKLSYVANSVEIPGNAETDSVRDIDLLYLGRLSPEKGPDILLDALSDLNKSGTKIGLTIAGDGPLMDSLRAKTRDHGLEASVKFLGYVNDAPALLKRARWLVMPSRTEGLPMSALEAMSHRTPIIATRVGELPNVIEQDCGGLLVPPENASALSAALLAATTMSESDWQLKSLQAFETVSERFALGRYGREIAAIYDGVFAIEASSARQKEASLASRS